MRRSESNSDSKHIGSDKLVYPKRERVVDEFGFEATKHALKLRGKDWDRVLTERREELTIAFTDDAAEATEQPKEHIGSLRFILTSSGLLVKMTVKHKAHVLAGVVQDKLAVFGFRRTKALYEPRVKEKRPAGYARGPKVQRKQPDSVTNDSMAWYAKRPKSTLDFFGRANVDQSGPAFKDEKEVEEEDLYITEFDMKPEDPKLLLANRMS